ncbi:hypothetical protein AXG93_1923s1500 [Marchantia polymorpha subsp. ruderalis]|uniref:PCI domain-containing protein n=1 Tax=Marchantia polymorpha subsp. ruderalis TaxID=1480154 RepID=A0A176VCK7_MARPO|nr:hypothetical protein AXG93_1923s1500 [Marchantia polymorpha subsp. ruderalis]
MAYGSIEGQKRLQDYVNRFIDALTSQNGTQLSALLAITSSPFRDAVGSALDLVKDPSRIIKQVDKHAPLGEMLGHHIRCMQAYRHRRYLDAYNSLEKSAKYPSYADREMANNGKVPDKLKGAGSFLMKVFGALAGKGPKRVGALYVTCQLFKVYFKLGTVHLCRSVIRSIETARVFDFEEFPTRDKVTYMYYTGRLEVFNDNFIQADKKLWYALGHCDPSKDANIRMILKYLVPVKLSLGILPNEWLLRKYHIMEYNDIVQALRRGDIRLLRYALQANEDQFLRSGVYLVLEKLELQVYQRLMKKIHLIQKQKDPSKAHQIKMDSILKALKWLQIDMDIDEVECIMATLIHKNLMRGYLSHKSKVVVLSKQDPFPLLSGKPCA